MINGSIHQEDIAFVNIYTPNLGAPKYIKQILIHVKEEIHRKAITWFLNSPLSSMHTSTRKKNQWRHLPYMMLDKMNLTDKYKTFYPKATECTFFSRSHRTLFRIDFMLVHKTILNKFKKAEIISKISIQLKWFENRN